MPSLHAASTLLFKNDAEDIQAMHAAAALSASSTGRVAAVRAWGRSALERRGVKIKSTAVVGQFADELNDLTLQAVAKEAAEAARAAEVTVHLNSIASDRLRLAAAKDPQINVIARAAAQKRGGKRGRAAPKKAAAKKKQSKLMKKATELLNRKITNRGACKLRPGFRFPRDAEKKEIVRRMAAQPVGKGAPTKAKFLSLIIDEYARNTKPKASVGGGLDFTRIDDKVQLSKSAMYRWAALAEVRA